MGYEHSAPSPAPPRPAFDLPSVQFPHPNARIYPAPGLWNVLGGAGGCCGGGGEEESSLINDLTGSVEGDLAEGRVAGAAGAGWGGVTVLQMGQKGTAGFSRHACSRRCAWALKVGRGPRRQRGARRLVEGGIHNLE